MRNIKTGLMPPFWHFQMKSVVKVFLQASSPKFIRAGYYINSDKRQKRLDQIDRYAVVLLILVWESTDGGIMNKVRQWKWEGKYEGTREAWWDSKWWGFKWQFGNEDRKAGTGTRRRKQMRPQSEMGGEIIERITGEKKKSPREEEAEEKLCWG